MGCNVSPAGDDGAARAVIPSPTRCCPSGATYSVIPLTSGSASSTKDVMTSAHDPGQPAIAANATSSARQRRVWSLGRHSPQRRRPMVGMAPTGADADVVEVPVAWPAPARPVGVVPVPRAGVLSVRFPPDRTGGGVACPRDSPRLAAARLCHLTSPTHCRRGSSTRRYLVDRHPRGDASDPTARRARPSRSPSAGQSVSTVQPGARSCTTSEVGHPRPRRARRGWTPRWRPPHCLPGGFRDDTPHAMQSDRRDVVWAPPRCSSSDPPARAGSQPRCTPPVSHRSAMPPPAIRRIEAERGAALAGYVPVTWRSNGALPP